MSCEVRTTEKLTKQGLLGHPSLAPLQLLLDFFAFHHERLFMFVSVVLGMLLLVLSFRRCLR